jgi:hypothetical protein
MLATHRFIEFVLLIRRLVRYDLFVDKKKFDAEMRRLQKFPELSDDERVLFAMSLSATPDERWARHENFLRSHGLFGHSERKAYGFK